MMKGNNIEARFEDRIQRCKERRRQLTAALSACDYDVKHHVDGLTAALRLLSKIASSL
jgi:hypothetical protein